MKKVLLLCSFAVFAPAHSMQWLRIGMTNAKSYATRQNFSTNYCQAITSLLPFMQARKVNALQSPTFKSDYKNSYDKQYSNNNSSNNFNRNWSSNFNWGKISSLVPIFWFEAKEEQRITSDQTCRAKELLKQEMLSPQEYQELLNLLQNQAIIYEIITTKQLREKLTVALASNSLEIQEIELGITLLSNNPELAQLFFTNVNPHNLKTFSYFYIGTDEKLQKQPSCKRLTPLAALLLKSIESLNEETSILLIKNVMKGIEYAPTENAAELKREILKITSAYGNENNNYIILSRDNKFVFKYEKIIAPLMYYAGIFEAPTFGLRDQLIQMHLYYTIQNDPQLRKVMPLIHSFDIENLNNKLITNLRRYTLNAYPNNGTPLMYTMGALIALKLSPELEYELTKDIYQKSVKFELMY